jgi:hypothetical protein
MTIDPVSRFAAIPGMGHRQLPGSSISKFCRPVSGRPWWSTECPEQSFGFNMTVHISEPKLIFSGADE